MTIVSRVKASLKEVYEADVSSNDGCVHIKVAAQKIRKTGQSSPALQMQIFTTIKEDIIKQILAITRKIPGVKDVICDVDLPYY